MWGATRRADRPPRSQIRLLRRASRIDSSPISGLNLPRLAVQGVADNERAAARGVTRWGCPPSRETTHRPQELAGLPTLPHRENGDSNFG